MSNYSFARLLTAMPAAVGALALALAGCGSSAGRAPVSHAHVPAEPLNTCIAHGFKDTRVQSLRTGLPRHAETGIAFVLGGPGQQGNIIYEAPIYTTFVYVFGSGAQARAMASQIRAGHGAAHYLIGRAVVIDDAGFIVPVSGALPQPALGVIRGCVKATT